MLGGYKKRFLVYLNKQNFDHNQGFVDPYEYHSWFFTFAKLFGVAKYDKLPRWTYISPIAVASSAVTGAIISVLSLIVYVKEFQIDLITECGTYFLILSYQFLLVLCSFIDKKHYHCLLRALHEDFQYICTKGVKYRDRFFENQKLTFKACVLTSIFTGGIGVGITFLSCISLAVYVAIHGNDGRNRPLPFAFCIFDVDMHATPAYEIMFFLSSSFSLCHAHIYIFMLQIQIVWVRQIMCEADVIIWNIQDLLEDVLSAKNKVEEEYYAQLIRSRLREIISMHQSMFKLMEEYAAVYKKCLMYEQKLAAPIICMTAYGVAEKYDEGEIQYVLLMLCVAVIVVTFIPCYLCTLLLEKVQSVSDACWETPFWKAGPVVRPYLVLIMQRSMRKLPIAAAGFDDISLQTYTDMLTRAYSCFNMLRQRGG